MICNICKKEFTSPEGYNTDICGTCGQILMDEEIAYQAREAYKELELITGDTIIIRKGDG